LPRRANRAFVAPTSAMSETVVKRGSSNHASEYLPQ
jgi:hypothetical protein